MPVRLFSWRFESFEILWILFFSFYWTNVIRLSQIVHDFDLQFPLSLKFYHLTFLSSESLLWTYLSWFTPPYFPYHQSDCCWGIWTEGGQMQCPSSHIKNTAQGGFSSLLPPAFVICWALKILVSSPVSHHTHKSYQIVPYTLRLLVKASFFVLDASLEAFLISTRLTIFFFVPSISCCNYSVNSNWVLLCVLLSLLEAWYP